MPPKVVVESHGKEERLKKKALRSSRKTDIEGADVTRWGRLFKVQAVQKRPDSGNR